MLSNRGEAPVLRSSVHLPTPAQKPLAYGRTPRWALRGHQLPSRSAPNQPFDQNAKIDSSLFVSFCAFLWQFLRDARSAAMAVRREGPRIPTEIVALSAEPNSLCSPKRTSPAWVDSPSPNRLSPASQNHPPASPWVAGEARAGFHPCFIRGYSYTSSPEHHPPQPILQHPSHRKPQLTFPPHSPTTGRETISTRPHRPTFCTTPQTRRKTRIALS